MSEINYTAYLFLTAKFDTIIQSCIQPLKFLGISGFSYMMIHKDGRYFGINNSLEYCSYYAQNATNNRSYIGDQSIIIPENKLITSSWPHKPLNEIHKAYHSRNLWHGIDICRQTENFLEAWTFMGTLNDKDLMGHLLVFFYLHFVMLLDLLKKFHLDNIHFLLFFILLLKLTCSQR